MISKRILVVDDERQMQKLLHVALTAAGFEVRSAETAAQALRAVVSSAPDAMILDLGLPDRDGKEVLKDVRTFSRLPIIILSARDRETEKIEALDLGADDYVEKPFGVGELLARLRVALRRVATPETLPHKMRFDGLTIDFERRFVSREGEGIKLTPKEFDLLALLASNPGRVLTHRHILTAIWGPAHIEDAQYLRVLMGQLRAKIEQDPTCPKILRTESGVGYRIAESEI